MKKLSLSEKIISDYIYKNWRKVKKPAEEEQAEK